MNSINRYELNDGLDFVIYRPGSGNTVEILDIAVNSERRKGIGKHLIDLVCRGLPAGTMIWAITRAENPKGQHFYEALGWHVVGVLRDFYCTDVSKPTHVDAIMYGRRIGDQS